MLGAIPYTGNKQSLLPVIKSHFPEYKRFIDCFCGGLSVSLNVDGPVIANDIQEELINMYKWMETADYKDVSLKYHELKLSNKSKTNYYKLRDLYNDTRDSVYLYLLVQHSFSNMIRFNPEGEFNASFGYRTFTRNTQKRWSTFKAKKDITFVNSAYYNLDIQKEDFVYCDPPYLITDAEYNKHWNEPEERKLLLWLDSLNERGIKFMLSNVIEHRGLKNEILIKWTEKYNMLYLDKQYVFNRQHAIKNKSVEVLIKNY